MMPPREGLTFGGFNKLLEEERIFCEPLRNQQIALRNASLAAGGVLFVATLLLLFRPFHCFMAFVESRIRSHRCCSARARRRKVAGLARLNPGGFAWWRVSAAPDKRGENGRKKEKKIKAGLLIVVALCERIQVSRP